MILWDYVKKHRKMLILALILATINQVFSLLDPQIYRLLIDNYATQVDAMPKEEFIRGVLLLLGAFVGVALVSRIAKNFQDYYVNAITQKVGTKMYADGITHVFKLPFKVFEDHRSGEVLQKLMKARTDSQNVIDAMINVAFLSAIGILFVIIYAFFVHWSIALTFILLIPTLAFSITLLSKKIGAAQKKIASEIGDLSGSTTETLRNVELVKSLALEEQELIRLNKVNDIILDLELKKIVLIRKLSFIQGTLVNAIRAGLMLLMLWLMVEGKISLGEFFTILFYSFFIFSPLGRLAEVVSKYQEAKASNEVFEEILNQDIEKVPKDVQEISDIESIRFDKVSFRYDSQKDPSLYDINLSIKQGETVAFVGPSGSGKTTMIKLLLSLYQPTKGKVIINGTALNKVKDVSSHIGFVAQETQLFAGTIRENLTFVKPDASDKECLDALKQAAANTILKRAEKGLDSRIGEGGIKLSGGERQRLAIARSLLRNPDLLIFDEATSSLDSITEKEITQTIKKVVNRSHARITILVAHRLSTILHADRIYVFENGRIIETGNHDSLVRKGGLYAALWREQSSKS